MSAILDVLEMRQRSLANKSRDRFSIICHVITFVAVIPEPRSFGRWIISSRSTIYVKRDSSAHHLVANSPAQTLTFFAGGHLNNKNMFEQ